MARLSQPYRWKKVSVAFRMLPKVFCQGLCGAPRQLRDRIAHLGQIAFCYLKEMSYKNIRFIIAEALSSPHAAIGVKLFQSAGRARCARVL